MQKEKRYELNESRKRNPTLKSLDEFKVNSNPVSLLLTLIMYILARLFSQKSKNYLDPYQG